jgi:hypothetical protein
MTSELAWDHNGKRIVGYSDRDVSLDVIGHQFELAIQARLKQADPDVSAEAHTRYDTSFHAKQWMVFYWTSLGGLTRAGGNHQPVAFQVGRWALDRCNAMILGDMLDEVLSTLYVVPDSSSLCLFTACISSTTTTTITAATQHCCQHYQHF